MSYKLARIAAISPDQATLNEIASVFDGNTEVEGCWTASQYPDRARLSELFNTNAPGLVFLDFSNKLLARPIAAELDSRYKNVSTAVICQHRGPDDFIELMQFGIREVLPTPIARTDVARVFARSIRKFRSSQHGGNVYAFLPCRAGAGATTLAVHSSAAAARISGQRTLLVDFDFRLGMTSFLFKLHSGYSVTDAIFSASELDQALARMISRRGSLEILGSAPVEYGGLNPEAGAGHLIDRLKPIYETICVDLPGEMRDYEIETLHRAAECFLVTAPDVGSLHMAKRKVDLLQSMGLHPKVSLILNRSDGSGSIGTRNIEEMLDLPVRFTVPPASKEIAEVTQRGEALEKRSALMTQIERIARRMTPGVTMAETGGHRFLETFSVTPIRERVRLTREATSGAWWKPNRRG